jgi:dipeptidyl aminopeptidase/acylaminoacyl peptidase
MRTAPYGTWESPITAELTTRAGLRFADSIVVDGDDVYWVESRPQEGGRSVIVRRSSTGAIDDVGPDDFNARTSVHEYGGGAYAVRDGVVYAAHFPDQRLYRIDPDGGAEPITPEPPVPRALRYADLAVGDGWLIGVRERHTADGDEPANELVRIPLDGGEPEIVASGHDFVSSPRISPDGTRLAWLGWDHPNMPWDGTELWVGDLTTSGHIDDARRVVGAREESLFQPEWGPDASLHVVSDRTGWWNLYRVVGDTLDPVLPKEAEFGVPQWVFGLSRYVFLDDGRIVAAHGTPGGDALVVIEGKESRRIRLPFGSIGGWFGSWLAARGSTVYAVGSGPDRPAALVRIGVDDGTVEDIRVPEGPGIDPAYVSIPEPITFPCPEGIAHALYYPPTNPEFSAPPGERPPVIVSIHGGPTSAVKASLDPAKLYWTSRGFGIVDVDYGGSTGYGRAYRRRLDGQWGVVDVRDCALAAAHLAAEGKADPDRLLIHGGSAGGYTTLLALALRDEFAAGASYFGVADLEALATDTHKFESRYLDRLVGPYPEAKALYVERSPITHVDRIDRPVILLQGLDDRVVPPSQAEMMCDALRRNGVPYAYVAFESEGHGFRDAANQIRALEAELSFYGQVLGFEPANDIERVEIVGL